MEGKGSITVQEAVVFEAASAEQGVERVQRLLALHGLGERPVDVGGAERGQLHRAGRLQQVFVPARVGGDDREDGPGSTIHA